MAVPHNDNHIRLHRFMGVDLELAPDVLVPREETELLGRKAVSILADGPAAPTVIDMCCGSGNLALGIANDVPSARIWGADLTDSTVALARRNVDRLATGARVSIRQGDLFAVLDVTTPWTLPPGHPFYDDPNVLLTPHLAGSLGVELTRLAAAAADEVERIADGRPPAHPVDGATLSITA